MILIGTSILTVGIVGLMLPTDNSTVSLISFVVIGLGCAPIYLILFVILMITMTELTFSLTAKHENVLDKT